MIPLCLVEELVTVNNQFSSNKHSDETNIILVVTDPVGDVVRFVEYFNETYGRNHPTFYQGSYSQVLSDAKQELRFLLIYLHQDSNQDAENFAR